MLKRYTRGKSYRLALSVGRHGTEHSSLYTARSYNHNSFSVGVNESTFRSINREYRNFCRSEMEFI